MFQSKMKWAALALLTLAVGAVNSGRATAAPSNSLIVGTWTATAPATGGGQKNICLVLDTKYTATWHESTDGGKTWTPFPTTYSYANNVLTLNFPQVWNGALLIGNTVDADNRLASFAYTVNGSQYTFQRSANKLHDQAPQIPALPVVPQPAPKPEPKPEPQPQPKPEPQPQPEPKPQPQPQPEVKKNPAGQIVGVKTEEVVVKGVSVLRVTVQANVDNLKGQECVAVMALLDEKGAILKTLDGKEVLLAAKFTPNDDAATITSTFTVPHQVIADLLDPDTKAVKFVVAIGQKGKDENLASKECETQIHIPQLPTPTNVPTPAAK